MRLRVLAIRIALTIVQMIGTIAGIVYFGEEGLSNATVLLFLFAGIATYWQLRLSRRAAP
ncbi:MAG: hypothetical protein HY329_24640 [Chloroflexi bacterium]|nr:hypothetical protein [Chloroflexota bacterium]